MRIVATLTAIILVTATAAQAGTIAFDPSDATVDKDTTFSLALVGTVFDEVLDGGSVNVSFDPTILQVDAVSVDFNVWDPDLSSGGGGAVPPAVIDNVAGTVTDVVFNSFVDRSGNFNIAAFEFRGIELGTSLLGLTEGSNPFASGGTPLPVTLEDGSVTVVPLPAAFWLFLSGLSSVVVWKRKAR